MLRKKVCRPISPRSRLEVPDEQGFAKAVMRFRERGWRHLILSALWDDASSFDSFSQCSDSLEVRPSPCHVCTPTDPGRTPRNEGAHNTTSNNLKRKP